MTSGPPIRIAVVGAGKIARDEHLPVLRADDRFACVAVVDPHPVKMPEPRFESFAALISNGPAVDAVAICTPPQVRAAVAREALALGLHVMLEKPPAMTVASAERLLLACPSDRTIFAAWHSREAPMVARAAAWLAGRRIRRGAMCWREDAHEWHPGQSWLWQPGGLGVFDAAINGLSILTAISPDPLSVESAWFEVPVNQHAPIAARVRLACDTGSLDLDLDFRESGTPRWDISIEADDGARLYLGCGGTTISLDEGPSETQPSREYSALYSRFAQLIAEGLSEVDSRPLGLVADAFLIAHVEASAPFYP